MDFDIDFNIILEPEKEKESIDPLAQFTALYLKAMRSGNKKKAEAILKERNIFVEASLEEAEKESDSLKEKELNEKIAEKANDFRIILSDIDDFANRNECLDMLEDTIDLRSEIRDMAKQSSSLPCKMFIVANDTLEESVIDNTTHNEALLLLKNITEEISS